MSLKAYEGILKFGGKIIEFKAKLRDPNWYEAPSEEDVEWVVLGVSNEEGRVFDLEEIDLFEVAFEAELHEAIVKACLKAKEAADEAYNLRDV